MSGEIKPFGGFCVPDSQNCPRKAEEDKLKAEVCQLRIIIATTKKLLLERAGKNDTP
jgi:hypothetical protein